MKLIVIGSSLSGKTTLVSHLRQLTNVPVSEMDEELTRTNNGQFSVDNDYKHHVLAPNIIKNIISLDNIIFFTNTDYFTIEDLKSAKEKGFKILQLVLNLEELQKRNEKRVRNENYDDQSQWFEGMLEYQKEIRDFGLVDKVIDVNGPIEKIVQDILSE